MSVLVTAALGRQAHRHPTAPPFEVFATYGDPIRVVTVAQGLDHPWSLAFLPGGDMLVTERVGRLRVIRNGVLDPQPVAGLPPVHARGHGGLLDVALHPNFSRNHLVYLTYSQAGADGATVALARGRLDGARLSAVEDIFVADAWTGTDLQFGSRIVFGRDGTLYMSIGDRNERQRAQDLSDHVGTIIRICDDGSVPDDNPFVGRPNVRPEIYSFGHRNVQGLAVHPDTGVLWATEHGPHGGDEVNVILPGRNYGWPLATFGREYDGATIAKSPYAPNTELPFAFWVPSIGISGMTFYSGNRFPSWSGNLLVAALEERKVQRMEFTNAGPYGYESLLAPLWHRIRDVRQGPDELLYVITDGAGLILRIEPAEPSGPEAG
jgi:aldose sugar dehydrogenase